MIGAGVITKDSPDIEDGVCHSDLFRKLRNAIVHDGYQPINAWADGRYYLPVNVKRTAKLRGKDVEVDIIAPDEDVETLCLQFAASYCEKLSVKIDGLAPAQKLRGLERSPEWFAAASNHPALRPFLDSVHPSRREDKRDPNVVLPVPLDQAVVKLRETMDLCLARLDELKSIPKYPFP
jgi:hypothetical protein